MMKIPLPSLPPLGHVEPMKDAVKDMVKEISMGVEVTNGE